MPNNDSHHHVVKTTEQWQDRAVEYWVVPRGTLCVELTPEKKTKIKIGEGSKYYSQLPYICDGHDMSNYYTKEETDRLLDNLNRMAIQSTDVYDTKDDLPLDGNKLGDVRFVKSTSEQKVDPDVYLWNGSKWIYVGYDFANIDLDRYLTKTEFHSEFDPVRDKVDEMYPKMHTHDNKDVLDRTERPFTIADKEKLDSLENYDDTEIRELIRETGHVHWNKHILDTITEDKLWTVQDREKFESLHNYDDTELRNRMGVVESKAHTHTNKDILDQTTAPFKTEDKQKLDSLENYDIFIGTDGRYPGVKGLVPAPSTLDIGTFLSSDGTWKKAGFDSDFIGATPYMDGEHGLVPAPLMGEQSYFLRGDGTWARVKNGDKYKAGEGITILSGEVISDTFPFEIFPKAATVTQYVIYGTASGVGNAVSGHYEVPIKVSAEGYSDRLQTISIADPLYDGDYIDFQKQVFAHYRTNIHNRCTIDPQYNYKVGIHSDGTISYHDPGAYGSRPFVSNPMEIIPGATYEITPWDTEVNRIRDFQAVMYLNMYDADMNRTRTIFQEYLGNTTVIAASNEKYMRLTRQYAPGEYSYNFYSVIYQLYPVETPCQLNELLLYPNVINTVDVLTTNKPNEIYVEVEEPEDIDPDDPMSQYSGIIYNDGVLDITQEDPNALNELTVHFRDNVDKTLTIPETPLEPATTTTLGGIIVGDNLTIDENGVLDAKGGDKYKAGEGIYILSGETTSDSFPFEIFAKASRTSQYVIYGSAAGVGDWDGTNYTLSITVSAPGETTLTTQILYNARLYSGDYVDYSRQIIHHSKQDMRQYISLYNHPTYGTEGTFQSNTGSVTGNYNSYTGVTNYIEVNPGEVYMIKAFVPYGPYDTYFSTFHCIFDENHVLTRYFSVQNAGVVTIEIQPGEKYARFVGTPAEQMLEPGFVYKLEPYEEPCVLPAIVLYPNKINTIDVSNTNKPSEIYFEAISDEPVDPDDPMSEYTGIIYNDGVIDVTQEDPNNLNELTFHYRDNVDKTLTIPATPLPIASDTTLGGIKVGNNLTIDPVTGVLSATGGGEEYVAGNGIEFTTSDLPAGYIQLEYVESLGSQSYIDTGVSHGFTAYMDLQYTASDHRQLMGLELNSGAYFGSNASEQFEMWYPITNSDTTQRNNVIWYHDEINPTRLEVDGSYVTDVIGQSNKTFKIFSPFASDGYGSSVKIYSVDIYDNSNTLIRKFIPCQSPSNVVGMYDSVNDVFYSPTGASLIAGQPVRDVTINAKLGNGLRFDSNGAIETIGGTQYEAGTGINIISDSGSTVSRTLKVNAQTAQANDYTIYGASGGVGDPSTNLMPQLTTSSIWADTWYADGTHEGEPAFSKNTWYGGITNEVYLTEGTYTFSLDVKLSSTSIQGLLANELNDQSRYPHYNQAATVDIMHYGPFYPVDTDWHRYSYTFEVTTAGYVACRAENVSAEHGTISVARPQLERGSVAHDYVEHDCYTIPITVSAPNETDIEVFIETSAPLGNGDSLNFIDDALPTLPLYQNKINTITVNTTVTPSRFAVDASSGSDVTSIIENDGVLDVTQEDPNALNELTFHYRDNVDKVITIPSTPLPVASDTTLGGIKVGEGLSVAQDGTLDVITDVITTFAEGDAIEFGTTPVPLTETITHIKWAINTIRDSSLSIIQAAEIEFYDENDQLLTFSAVSGAFSPSVSTRPIYGTVQYSQTPDKLVDGSTLYKCCCTNFTSSIPEIEFTFELSTPINAQDLKNYRWFTADDQEGRDPISWEVYVSPNGGDWICVHEVTNATVPTARQTSTEYYTVNKPSFSERTINVKYGAGLALDANGALTVVSGGTEYDAGPGIEIGAAPSTLYTQVEYLKSTGTQYILTDIIPDYTMRIALDVKFGSTVLSSAKSVKKIFGYYNGASTNTSFLTIWLDDDADHGNLDYICFYDGFRWVQGGPRTNELDDVDVTTRSTVIIQRGICSWGSATCTTLDSPIAEPNPTTGMPIFAGFESNRYDIFGRRDMYLYSFKIYNSESELIHKLVPVKRNSDDELGLYDLKTNTFYTNAGTGTFAAGSEIGPIPGDDEVISTKLGVGLTFDSNDAVTLDETTDLIFNCDYSE